jgi:hypothetical protein
VVQAPAIKDAEERPDPEAEEMLLIEKPSKVVETDITVRICLCSKLQRILVCYLHLDLPFLLEISSLVFLAGI